MVDVHAALDRAGLKNVHVREYVEYWAELTGAGRIEVVSASDDARLISEALAEGEIAPVGEGCYYSRSYAKDTARSEERTIVATSNPADKGVYDNWRPAAEMRPNTPCGPCPSTTAPPFRVSEITACARSERPEQTSAVQVQASPAPRGGPA